MTLLLVCMPLIALVVHALWIYFTKRSWDLYFPGILSIGLVVSAVIALSSYVNVQQKMIDTEHWSGTIVGVEHKEEYDEWHPPRTEHYTETVNGISVNRTRTIPGYTEHHSARNWVMTSDGGSFYVDYGMNGVLFNDAWPNSDKELESVFKIGTPTASSHTYKNKVQASYSIYKHEDINPNDYKDLPKYPQIIDYFMVDQIIGTPVPMHLESNKHLMALNSKLNKMVTGEDGKTRSWKQVNLIFVNLTGQPIEAAYALQDKWENGNKNDFIVAFALVGSKFEWVYPFSWTESEDLKVTIRDTLMDSLVKDDFRPIIDETGKLVAEMFERKQFAEFSYIEVEVSPWLNVVQFILVVGFIAFQIYSQSLFRR